MDIRRLAICSLVIFGYVTLVVGNSTTDNVNNVVKATKFVLTNDKGEGIAILGSHEGRPVLTFLDEKGNSRLTMGIPKNGLSGLFIYNEDENLSSMLADSSGNPIFLMLNKNGKVLNTLP